MYTAPFRYVRANTLSEAEDLFRQSPDARYIAGGQTLIPTMKQRLSAPSDVIDIGRIGALNFIRHEGNILVIGAGTPHADVAVSEMVRNAIPALAALAGEIGDPAVRHKGTLGGSVANNDPAADYPAGVLGLGARVETTARTIGADEFFTGMFETVLEPGEIITEISFPLPRRAGYAKFPNPASRYAMVGVFVADFPDGVRVAVTGAAPSVFRFTEMEAALAKQFAPDAIAGIAIASDGLNADLFGSAEYRAHLVGIMAKRAIQAAML
ncbi:MAG TPA: xanthine dehydrogenase family protein subunit M [Micropepsaceae bacterium]|nr:xanthine dehydrogenase family protein subunit M [Micropepsaceae bacterium]